MTQLYIYTITYYPLICHLAQIYLIMMSCLIEGLGYMMEERRSSCAARSTSNLLLSSVVVVRTSVIHQPASP